MAYHTFAAYSYYSLVIWTYGGQTPWSMEHRPETAKCCLRYTFLQETGVPSLQSLLGLPQSREARPKEGQAVLEDFFIPGVKWRSRCIWALRMQAWAFQDLLCPHTYFQCFKLLCIKKESRCNNSTTRATTRMKPQRGKSWTSIFMSSAL